MTELAKTIGVLGGGQLGRMVMLEGRKMGYRFVVLDPAEDCPGAQVADRQMVAAYDDVQAAEELARVSDLIVYEFENIDPQMVIHLESLTQVPQGSKLLQVTRNRLQEKQAIEAAGAIVSPYQAVRDQASFRQALAAIGLPAVLKTATGGYDGKGQWMLKSEQDVDALLANPPFDGERELILERWISFAKEISVVVARSQSGETVAFPPTVNLHRNHILHLSLAPAPLSPTVEQAAQDLATKIAQHLNMVGLLAVEMFLLPDGQLYMNELAPRPHNSGHYTYDACTTSQFEQFLRAVLDFPLHSPTLRQAAAMVNLLGEHQEAFVQQMNQLPADVKIHWYGKKEAKVGRKMGHLTFLAESAEQVLEQVEQSPIWSELTAEERKILREVI